MKQLFVLALLALGLVIVVPTALPAAPGDAQGPPCGNITSGDGSYSADVINFTVSLQAPACSFVTYSFFVTDTSGDAIPLTPTQDPTSCTPETPDGGCVKFVYTLPSGSPSTVCIYATTYIHGHLVDRAPNVSDPICPPSSPSISLVNTGVSPGGAGFG